MFQINRPFLFSILLPAFALSGCASVEGDFPSLAKRPYEKANPIEEPPIAVETLTKALPADLQRQVDSLVARSSAAHAAFETSLPSVRAVIQSAGNPAPGSEPWINAHMVLSRTDSTRADNVAALGEIDQLIAREREKGADAGLIALLLAPQQKIAERLNAENTEIERLTQLIGL
jgi:hypothetical protein